jgi:hypothetical protein
MRPLILLFAVLILNSCRKDGADISSPPGNTVTFRLSHYVDGFPLVFDKILYTNTAGNEYSIEKLQYYLSGFKFYKSGRCCYSFNDVFYIDARNKSTSSVALVFPNTAIGIYDSVACFIGIAPGQNISNSLPATYENTTMGWPDEMGGGYHFFKMEGRWVDSTGFPGYAIHLGRNGFQVQSGFRCSIDVGAAKQQQVEVNMNLNEWFRTPTTYSFPIEGVYTMGNDVLMRKIAENGADVLEAD